MVVLGIDAAWTAHRASGVAVLVGEPSRWRCAGAFASYPALFERTGCREVLAAVEAIAGEQANVVSVDMPLATVPITSRRFCDNQISRHFGKFGCGVHSSTPERPGAVSTQLMATFRNVGYELAVHGAPTRDRQVIEVYPHIAVMRLLGESYRVPYKVARAGQYWPDATPRKRRANIRANLGRILSALQERIGDVPLELPRSLAGPTEIKHFEDALDGVVCAWIGAEYLAGNCRSYGDETAAIWAPDVQGRPQ
jgi:predicted RNase H-like nuclease